MSKNFVFDATPENFREMVIGNSTRGPVMVNYWSATAGPCLKLWPTLEKLVNEFAGRFLLINLNTDKYRSFAQNELGVRSVPTLQVFLNQQVVDVMHGAESEQSIRRLLSRHLPRASDSLVVESVKLYNEQRPDDAIAELQRLQKADPENPRIASSLIKLLFRESRFDEMERFIATQSTAVKNNEEVISLLTHAQLQQEAAQAGSIDGLRTELEEHPENAQLIYRMAACEALNENLETALEWLLQALKLEPTLRNNLPARTMVLLLNAMENQQEKVRQYRARMMDVLSGQS